MTNFELIGTFEWPRCKQKHKPAIISIFEQIDAQPWAKDNVPGRHFTYAHAIKHIILATVKRQHTNKDIDCLIAHIHSANDHLQAYQEAHETVREVYSLPVVLPRQAETRLSIFGLEVKYRHHHLESNLNVLRHHAPWTCPTVEIAENIYVRDSVTMPFSSLSQNELIRYAEDRIRQELGAEIDQSAPSFSDNKGFYGYSSDHYIKISFPNDLVYSHPDDIDKWLPRAIAIYRQDVQEIREKTAENTKLKINLQQGIDELMAKKTDRPRLYLPYEAGKNKDERFQVSVMFVYMNPLDSDSCVCAVKAKMPDRTVVELFSAESFTDNLLHLPYVIGRFIESWKSEIRVRRILYANQNPLSFTINPICRIILDSANRQQIGAIVETLRKQSSYNPKRFPDCAGDQSIKAFEARVKRTELQLKFTLSDKAIWKWDVLFVKVNLPSSIMNGLQGAKLGVILDDAKSYSDIANLIIKSAKKTKTGINIEIEPVGVQLQGIYG